MGRGDKACLLCLTAEVPPQYLSPRRPLGPEAQGKTANTYFWHYTMSPYLEDRNRMVQK
jgi:hypothetical protein